MKISKYIWKDVMRGAGLRPCDQRPGLKTTVLTVRSGKLHTTSLNEQVIVHQYGDLLEGHEGEAISIDLAQVPRTKGDVELKQHGDQVMLLADGEMWMLPVPEVPQPDCSFVEAKREPDKVCLSFDTKVLLKALEAVKDEKVITLRVCNPLRAMLLEGQHSRAVVMPMRHFLSDEEQNAWEERDRGEPATL